MNSSFSFTSTAQKRDNIDYSEQGLTEFPAIPKPNLVIKMNLSINLLRILPSMHEFNFLRYLDVSNNKFTDLSALSRLNSLRELDISHNRIVSLGFVATLPNLEILRASFNRIVAVSASMPQSLIDLDLSHNEINSLEFLQKKVPVTIERIDVSNNLIIHVMQLRYIAVFQNLRILNAGLYHQNQGIQIIPFLKHICPSLELFDDNDCDEPKSPNFPDDETLFECLMGGDETELQILLQKEDKSITWDEPTFIPFNSYETELQAPINDLEQRLHSIESRIPNPKLLSPVRDDPQEIKTINALRHDIGELKKQLAQLSQMLFVHDAAVKQISIKRKLVLPH